MESLQNGLIQLLAVVLLTMYVQRNQALIHIIAHGKATPNESLVSHSGCFESSGCFENLVREGGSLFTAEFPFVVSASHRVQSSNNLSQELPYTVVTARTFYSQFYNNSVKPKGLLHSSTENNYKISHNQKSNDNNDHSMRMLRHDTGGGWDTAFSFGVA